METSTETHSLQEGAKRDSVISTRYFVCSTVGGLLCIVASMTSKELLAYTGLGGFLIPGLVGFAYRRGCDQKMQEFDRINAQ